MGISLSGGPYQFNRFDEFEKKLAEASKPDYLDFDKDGDKEEPMKKALKDKESKGASGPHKMEKAVKKAGKKAKAKGAALREVDKEEEAKEEADSSGISEGMMGKIQYPTGKKMKFTKDKSDPMVAAGRKAAKEMNLKMNEEEQVEEGTVAPMANLARRGVNKLNNDTKAKAEAKIMEDSRMARYSRALGRMGAMYNPLEEKKELPDFIKDKMKEKHDKAHEDDKDKKESKKEDKKEEMKEDVTLTKEMVVQWLVSEGYATNEVSAEILHTHISDEFLEEIEGRMIAEMGPAYPSETKAQAKAQSDHREGKSSAGLKTGKNPGLKMSHTSGANKQA